MAGADAARVEGAGVALAWRGAGAAEGPAVVVAHGMASDAAAWAARLDALAAAGPGRALAYDRRGYGGSEAPEPYAATTVEEQAEDLAAVIERLGAAPALVVGEDLGALAVLDLLKRHRALVASAVLVEPPLHAFVVEAAEELGTARLALQEALAEGGPALAVDRWLGEDDHVDPGRRARARLHARAFFADFAGLSSWPVTRGELRALDAPAVVLTGAASTATARVEADALAGLLPRAQRQSDGDVLAAVAAVAAG